MNKFFGKNHLHLNDREIDLKTPAKQSHNDNACDEHIIAWVNSWPGAQRKTITTSIKRRTDLSINQNMRIEMEERVALYARYSSDLQRDASIEDQLRLCTEKAQQEGWRIVDCYTDAGISGASLMRHGIQSLMQAAAQGKFDVLLAEAMDRLSRDQEDIAGLFKRMEFAGVKIITLSEGEITSLHIGLKGTMNAMFLKDLADKTRRGLRGRVEKGKSSGGLAYGYRVVKKHDANGEILRGEREIDDVQAGVVCRIFNAYAYENKSPKAIAMQLNKENIPCPSGKAWSQSTINGNRKRGTGILNNMLYIGEIVWNRQRYLKDPNTGKRVTRMNDESLWVRRSVPELRIVDQALWDAVKARQKVLDRTIQGLHHNNRPRYLLSGLIRCGVCGGGFAKINASHYGCAAFRNKGASVCSNHRTIKRDALENHVLSALQTRLMREDLVEIFCAEYTKHLNFLHAQHNAARERYRREMDKLAHERENLIQAIKDGVPAVRIKDDLERVSNRREEIEKILQEDSAIKPVFHPAMASRFYQSVKDLRNALEQDGSRDEAAQRLRALVEKIVLTPKGSEKHGLSIDLYGDLAGILNMTTQKEKRKMLMLQQFEIPQADACKNGTSVGCGGRI